MNMAVECRRGWLLISMSLVFALSGVHPAAPKHTAMKIPACQLEQVQSTLVSAWFTDHVYTHSERYRVHSSIPNGDICELPVGDFLCYSGCEFNISRAYYARLLCDKTSPLQIIFTNPQGIHDNIVSYLDLVYCHVSLLDIAVYGRAVDLKVLSLEYCSIADQSERNDSLHQPAAEESHWVTEDGVPGLDAVVSFTFIPKNTRKVSLPSLLYTHKWPALAELELRGVELSKPDVNLLKMSMPNLQSLQISSAIISSIPDFPWNSVSQVLPRNLSRTMYFNEVYADSWGLSVKPNFFRRLLFLQETLGIRNLSNYKFKGRLDMLHLASNQIEEVGRDTFQNVAGLYNLKMMSNLLRELPPGVFRNLTSLTQLDLSNNYIEHISVVTFEGLGQLKVLKITNNRLQQIAPRTFYHLKNLVYLDLSNNSIQTFSDEAFGFNMPVHFATLNLNHNNLIHFPIWIFTTRSLRNIYMSRNLLSFDILKRDIVDLQSNIISFKNKESSSSLDNPYKPRDSKIVDLSYNNFTILDMRSILSDRKKYKVFMNILNFFKLDLKGNDIRCACQTYSMYEFLKKEKLKPSLNDYSEARILESYYDAWKCKSPKQVEGQPIVNVKNDTFMCQTEMGGCPKECTCLQRLFDKSVVVNCSGRHLKNLPLHVPKETDTILFNHNDLLTIRHTKYIKSIKHLDLANNKIKTIDDSVITSLDHKMKVNLQYNLMEHIPIQFKNLRNVSLMLSGNYFACDCNMKWVVRWMLSYRTHILDINKVVCASGVPKSNIIFLASEDEFICEISKTTLRNMVIGITLAMVVIFCILVTMYKFRGEIKVFLYFHFKWHPFDRTDHTDIVDKLYDAFVSYNQEDTSWVLYTLRTTLERSENPYRLCIHERDFKPGGAITDNVLYSVKYSRRMIMVLTKNYLKSEWCRLEFKSAHRRVLKDRSNYLIVILFDGLNVDDMDEELKLYLKTNTYIKYNSSWFWERLHYAMPEKPLSQLRKEAFPEGGYDTLFPTPESVAIMQHVQNIRRVAENPNADVKRVLLDTEVM